MNDDFGKLFELLEGPTQEVKGRAATKLSPELREKLKRFAAGSCTEEERGEVKRLLQEEPDLIPALVHEGIALRQPKQ